MTKFILLAVVVMVAVITRPADCARRAPQPDRSVRVNETPQQAPPEPEAADPENASAMTNKIMECRSILQQAGIPDLGNAGKSAEAEPEIETEEPKGGEEKVEPMSTANFRKNGRKY